MHIVHFGCAFTAAIIMGHFVLRAISDSSLQPGESSPDSFIGFDSAPDDVLDGSVVRVRYRCSGPCQIAVEVVTSTLRRTDLVVFRKRWFSNAVQVYNVHQVLLRWPPSILYQRDFFNRHVLDVQNVTVRAWLDRLDDASEPGTYHGSRLRISKVLRVKPPSERPAKPPTECPSWPAQLMWRMNRHGNRLCRHESGTIDMLKFPLASTGEHFGVVRTFQPFIDGALERARLRAVTKPSVTLSVWIYLLKWCHRKLCGIIHHVDRNSLYGSVLMQLTDAGDVIIQARVTTGEDEAFRAGVMLPLWKWIRLDCYIQDSKVKLDTTWDDETRRYVYEFKDSIHYDDTDGYFVIGGGKYLSGIRGYFGPIKYYRFGTDEVRNPQSETLQRLEEAHRECRQIKAFTRAFLQQVTRSHLLSGTNKGVCRLWGQSGEKISKQTWSWEQQLNHSTLFDFLQAHEEEIRAGSIGIKELSQTLFEQAIGTVFIEHPEEIKINSKSVVLLQLSSCFGNHRASLLLAAIHLSGLEHAVNQQKGHVFSLIGAAGDNRFVLMHTGYKHMQGIDGFPKDPDVAYSYYSNAGAQTNVDSSRMYENTQYIPEHIYLSDEEALNSFTHQTKDIVEYLKFQADRGDPDAQKQLGTTLYWGQNGVIKDTSSAVKWLERSAMQMKDPSAMYDYSILLMKGRGVKRNYTRGFQLMEKAAAMGSIKALNGLGWYHGNVLNDHRNAVKYFAQAALNGSEDGMFNLGVYHLYGKDPDSPRTNETAAVLLFLSAARLGHAAAAVEAAWYLSTGSLEGVSQDAERAVIMLKTVCEQNGHLGFMIREALRAYLQGSWREALVGYVLAAESGLGLAQSNAAHLCEEMRLGRRCQWRYHNFSALNHDPHPSALLKMGDYYYSSCSSREEDSLSLVAQAVSMYGRAALAGSPQGMYNVAALARLGHALPANVRSLFNVSRNDERDVVMEKILRRCMETEASGEAVTPCSVALLGVQMGKAWSTMTQNGAQLLLAYASLLSAIVLAVILPLQSCVEQRDLRHRAVAAGARASSVTQRGGIMGGIYGAAGNQRLTGLNGEQWLRQTGDLAVTLSGVCLCALWTTLLYHLL